MCHKSYMCVAVLALVFLSACEKREVEVSAPQEPVIKEAPLAAPMDLDDPESCKGCHGQVYDEWAESMHSRAHHDKDPIFGSMRALRIKKQGAQIADQCVQCHNPRSPDQPDEPAGKVGVSCAACHLVKQVHLQEGKVGVQTLSYDETGAMHSARALPGDASPVHLMGAPLAGMQDGVTLCLACHNQTKSASGAPACTTGPEYMSAATRLADGEKTCVSCHMPEVKGSAGAVSDRPTHRSHNFNGPHRAWYQDDTSGLAQAVEVSSSFQDNELRVELTNKSGHALPSGFPGRMMILKVDGVDAQGELTWHNFKVNAMKEAPESVFNKVYHDKQGEPVPAAFADKLVSDTRLKPDEQRALTFDVPAEVVEVRVKLLYFLLPPPLSDTLGISDQPEAKPVVFFDQRVSR